MFKKIMLIASASILTFSVSAQGLINKISDNAVYVMTVNGGNVLSKVSQKEIEESLLYKQLSRNLFGRGNESKSLNELGVDLKKEMVFAVEYNKTSKMVYVEFFYPIVDKDKFGKYIQEMMGEGKVVKGAKYNTFTPRYSNDRLVWNKEFAVFFQSNYVGDDYDTEYNSYYYNSQKVDEVMEEYEQTNDFYAALDKIDKKYIEIEKNNKIERERQYNEDAVETVEAMDATEVVADAAVDASYDSKPNDYYDRYREAQDYFDKKEDDKAEKMREAREKHIADEADKRLATFFNSSSKGFNSIANTASYKKSTDATADATLWFKNDMSKFFILGSSSYRYGYNRNEYDRFLENDINGETVAKLYFGKDKARIKIDGEYGEMAKNAMTSVFNKTIDAKFFDYMKKDLLAYFTISGSTQNLFKEMPSLYAETYKKLYPNNESEIGLAADLFSVFIDEEAIGELVVGDAVFVVNGINSKEVTYKTYEYDDNYNMTQVEKTKKEILPEFLFMMNSKNEKIINKIFKLGITKKVLTAEGSYFVTTEKNGGLPLNLFMAYKDDMFFVSTQESEIKEVLAGGKGNLSKEHRAIIEANTSVVYYNNKKMLQQLPKEEIKKGKQQKAYDYIMEKSEDSYWIFNAKKGNIDSEITINVPKSEKNSAKYFLDMLNKMIEIDKN